MGKKEKKSEHVSTFGKSPFELCLLGGPCSGAKPLGPKTLEHLFGVEGGNKGFCMIEGFRV